LREIRSFGEAPQNEKDFSRCRAGDIFWDRKNIEMCGVIGLRSCSTLSGEERFLSRWRGVGGAAVAVEERPSPEPAPPPLAARFQESCCWGWK